MERVNLAVELTPTQVRPIAYRVISKKYGINLKSSALEVLAKHLGRKYGSEWRGAKTERFLDEIARLWRDEDRGLFLEGEPLQKIINDIENAAASQATPGLRTQTMHDGSTESKRRFHWRDYYKVVTAAQQRRFVYNPTHHRYDLGPQMTGSVLGDVGALVKLFPSRYHILLDRIQRSGVFDSKEREITSIKNMLGRDTNHFFLFGLLSRLQGSSGSMWLVDNSSQIELTFVPESRAADDHYYSEGSFVICEGQMLERGKFVVLSMGPPYPEPRAVSREKFGNVDFMSLISPSRTHIERIDYNFMQVLAQEETKNTHHRIMFLGCDLYLDSVQHLDALRHVLTKFEQNPPIGLVFIGSFCSIPFQAENSIAKYTENMASLALLLKEFPQLCKETKMLFVPGPNDPWQSSDSEGAATWPLAPLPDLFTRRISLAASDVSFGSNPSRLCYLSQEILIVSDKYGQAFRQTSLNIDEGQEEEEDENAPMEETQQEQDQQETLADTLGDFDLDTQEADRQFALNDLAHDTIGVPAQQKWTHNSQNEQARKLVATILDQAHLSPFSTQARPLVWEQEHALSLAQWPDVLVVADSTSPRFAVSYHECTALNPGRFLRAGSIQWLEYSPSTNTGILMSDRI